MVHKYWYIGDFRRKFSWKQAYFMGRYVLFRAELTRYGTSWLGYQFRGAWIPVYKSFLGKIGQKEADFTGGYDVFRAELTW